MSLNTTRLQKEQLLLYAVTDRAWVGKQTLFEQVEDALKGGATIIQLREKGLDENTFLQEAKQLAALCHSYHVPLIINDNVQIALESGADGVHVGIEDAPVAQIRQQTPPSFIIGATAKTVAQAQAAERAGADYLGVGAVFPSPTKQAAIRITNDQLKEICSSVNIPAVAIGGISLSNVEELAGGGMDGIAVVSAIFAAEHIEEATKELKDKTIALLAASTK
ncbi:MAG: thiamine phosphate synthase [Lachnospiraceae bacterium]|nr:thiamine phosphate synthase [Lachnospiraceae bacterium]MDD7176794.1 thiamine phosphate synthase [bacterium]MDY5518232.1 thiamine phosphate synthase [Lachnospiraceae bacterium]